MTIRIGIAGIGGRMGQELLAAARADPAYTVAFGLERPELVAATAATLSATIPVGTDPFPLLATADVLIDFTTPEATLAHARACTAAGKGIVAGTTGLFPEQLAELRELGQRTPVFYARNMSVGVNALLALLPALTRALAGYDIELTETHHRHKQDAPSGTALALAEAMAGALPDRLEESAVYGRHGIAPRQPGEIGIHALRGGGNSGEHVVLFASEGEEIRLSHRALSRRTFAHGALRAATWLAAQPPGFYGMADLVG